MSRCQKRIQLTVLLEKSIVICYSRKLLDRVLPQCVNVQDRYMQTSDPSTCVKHEVILHGKSLQFLGPLNPLVPRRPRCDHSCVENAINGKSMQNWILNCDVQSCRYIIYIFLKNNYV